MNMITNDANKILVKLQMRTRCEQWLTSRKGLIFFHILVLQVYWDLTESRIPLKPVLGGVRIVALVIISHEQTQ